MAISNGTFSFSFLGQEARLSAKTDKDLWFFQKWFRIPMTIQAAGEQITVWVNRSDLIKQLRVTSLQISSAKNNIETLAQNVRAAEIQRIDAQLKNQHLPHSEKTAELLYEAQRKRQNQFFPRSNDIPVDLYVNDDGKIFIRGAKISDCNLGAVYECIQLGSNRRVAVKDIKIPDRSATSELDAMKKLQGVPGALPLLSSSLYPEKYHFRLAIFTPRYEMTLAQCKDSLTPKQKEIVGKQILKILSHLSTKGIHRDISLKNILIDPTTLKIQFFDFEHFLFIGDDPLDKVGTPEYYSPEYAEANNRTIESATTPKVDVWAAAISLLELFDALPMNRTKTVPKEENWIFGLKKLKKLPLAFLKTLHRMTQICPSKRCTAPKALATVCPQPKKTPIPTFPWKHGLYLRRGA